VAKLELVQEVPDPRDERVVHVPAVEDWNPNDCTCVRAETDDGIWFGAFEKGTRSSHATGCWTVPGGDCHLVCAKGSAYLVDPTAPDRVEELHASVAQVFVRPDGIVCTTLVDAFALRRDRIVWRARRFALDGLKAEVVGEELVGMATTPEGGELPFRVDLKTGAVTGGWEQRRRDEMG